MFVTVRMKMLLTNVMNFGKKRILLVEDDGTSVIVYTSFMEEWGLVVIRARNGAEALRMMREGNKFDLILMDINMPVMNGIEATLELRKEDRTTCIIILTGGSQDEDIVRALSAGANDYIFKPVSEIQLLRVLIKWLPG